MNIFSVICNMSIASSIIIVVVLLARRLLKWAPKSVSCVLWLVVLFRLLCPISLGWSFSLMNLLDAPTTESGQIAYVNGPVSGQVPDSHGTQVPPAAEDPMEDPQPADPGKSPVLSQDPGTNAEMPSLPGDPGIPDQPAVLPEDPGLSSPDAGSEPFGTTLGLDQILTMVWLAGLVGMLAYHGFQLLKLRRRLAEAVPLEGRVYVADNIGTPFILGLFLPKIYIPSDLTPEAQAYVLRHEQCHLRRWDHVVKLLAFLALCIHWFNPLVWLSFFLLSRDMELSCDEAVLRQLGESHRAEYSAVLLECSTQNRILMAPPLAFGQGDTKERIKNMLNYKKPTFWAVLLAVVLCVALIVFLMGNPTTSSGETETTEATAPPQTSTPTETTEPQLEEGPWPLESLAPDSVDYSLDTGLSPSVRPVSSGNLSVDTLEPSKIQMIYQKDPLIIFQIDGTVFGYRLDKQALEFTIDIHKALPESLDLSGSKTLQVQVSTSGITMLLSIFDSATNTYDQTCNINLVKKTYVYEDYNSSYSMYVPTGREISLVGPTLGQLVCTYREQRMQLFPEQYVVIPLVESSPYDTNGDGILQYHEFPIVTGDVFGLTGVDAQLFNAAAEAQIKSEYWYQCQEEGTDQTMLELVTLRVYGQYPDGKGNTNYVCSLWVRFYYDLGLGLSDAGQYLYSSSGGGGAPALITLSPDGELVELVDYPHGGDPDKFYQEICGPLTDLAQALTDGTAESRVLVNGSDTELLYPYLDYYFPGWR